MNSLNDDVKNVIDAADIVQIINEYIPLKQVGNDFKGLCPFHSDSNPSLSVSPSKKVFKCFSCNTAGNVIQFVQKIENISFKEALKKVASKCNVKINVKDNPNDYKFSKYYEITSEACKVYEFYLNNTKDGIKALEYLNNRNIPSDIIKRFNIGLSNHEGNVLVKALVDTEKYLPIDLQEIGLVGYDKPRNRYYDMFRGRIMFPLKDLRGNIVGFSGRIYDTTSNSKYMNSMDNIIFKKSNILYNYSDSFNIIKQKNHVIVFEGFMDVIAAYKAGVENTLATMGTALTEEQIKIILKLTDNVTLCYDGDSPGIEATKRAIKLFSKYNISPKCVVLPEGMDPDEYLNAYGKEKTYNLLVNENVSCIDYLYSINYKNLNLNNSNSIINFQKNVYEIIDSVSSNALKSYLINKLSTDLNVKKDDLENDYNKNAQPKDEAIDEVLINPTIDNVNIDDLPIDYNNDEKAKVNKYNKYRYENAEKGILYLSFYNKKDCMTIKKKLGIDDFVDKVNRDILYRLYEYYDLNEQMNQEVFFSKLNELEIERLNQIINTLDIYMNESIDDYVELVKMNKYEKSKADIQEEFVNGNINETLLNNFIKCKKNTTKIKKK